MAKLYYIRNKLVSTPGKPFKPGLMFVGKARTVPQSGASEMCFTWVFSGLTHKHQTIQGQTLQLMRTFVNYDCKEIM